MAPRTDFLTKQRQQIEARLKELQPAHEEYLTLLKARDALAAVTLDTAGDVLIDMIIRTANGRLTAAEALGHREFSLTKLYRSA